MPNLPLQYKTCQQPPSLSLTPLILVLLYNKIAGHMAKIKMYFLLAFFKQCSFLMAQRDGEKDTYPPGYFLFSKADFKNKAINEKNNNQQIFIIGGRILFFRQIYKTAKPSKKRLDCCVQWHKALPIDIFLLCIL